MRAVKAVKQSSTPSAKILSLLEDFRCMVNDCIRIGLQENITSMKALSLKAYHQLETYDIATYYRLTAISKATGILRNYRKSLRKNPNIKEPYACKLILVDCYGFKVEGNRLRITIRKGEYEYIPLSRHTLETMSAYTTRSITLTARTISITFSKETAEIEPVGAIGIDRNLNNITITSSDGSTQKFDLSKATEIKQTYREVKSHFKRNDGRIRRRIFGKYGTLQRNRVQPILHNVSASVVKQAKEKKFAIVMENIKGIRKLYRRGNGQGKYYRARLNSWSYGELQRQIEYKARWNGIPVIYIPPQKTSANCSICGSRITEWAERKVWCPLCRTLMDRDENAAKNILAKGAMRFMANGEAVEAVMRTPTGNPQSRCLEVNLQPKT